MKPRIPDDNYCPRFVFRLVGRLVVLDGPAQLIDFSVKASFLERVDASQTSRSSCWILASRCAIAAS